MGCYFEAGHAGNDYPLDHPVVAWNNIARRATVTVSTEETGREGTNAATPTTYDFWKPTAAASTYQLSLTSSESISAMCLAAHDMGTAGSTVQFQVTDGASGWTNVGPAITPTDDTDIMLLFKRRTTDDVRLSFTTAIPTIGVIFVSDVIELPQKTYQEVQTPIDLANKAEARNTESTKGQFLGRSIQRVVQENDLTISHLAEDYVRETLKPFFDDATEYPYFLAERPVRIPEAVSYRWRKGLSIQPQRIGVRNYTQVVL